MSKPIPPLDLMWLVMETPASPTHVGGAAAVREAGGPPGVVREIVAAYRGAAPTPPFNYVPRLGGTGVPRFVEADALDLSYHVQHLALPAGASYDDLLRLVADLHEPVLDRDRPLFRNWVIDGLPGDRFAMYSKVHHAIIDGASGAKRIYASLSPTPDATRSRRRHSPRRCRCASRVRRRRCVDGSPDWDRGDEADARVEGRVARRAPQGLATLLGLRPGRQRAVHGAPAPMNEPLRMARSLATLSLPLDGDARRRHGTSARR